MSEFQRPGEYETRLGHGAFGGVHKQYHAVDHLQDALHFPAEIRVARRVHDVDFGVAVTHGGVFRQNRNAALPFEVAGVHHALHDFLIGPVYAALFEHFIHERRFPVVDMGDNGDIS